MNNPIKFTVKDGYTLLNNDAVDNSMYNRTTPNNAPSTTVESALLFTFALAGGIGNISAIMVTLICPTFRHLSTAFLFHHCFLDAIKSGFCIPFGYSLLHGIEIPHCEILGASYILLMTVSAYNLLALLVNEEYQCSLTSKRNNSKNKDGCCIAFGVAIIWFTTVLLHLGVIFLPGSSEFSKDVGNCVYRHGITKNYVIHTLWIFLVTGAIAIAAFSFFKFFRKLQSSVKSRKWTFLHKSLSSLSPHNMDNDDNEEIHYEFDDISSQKATQLSRGYLRRIVIMICMVVSFVVCWYPLFILTLTDIHYKQPAYIYRRLMILAWAHPITTPVFCSIIFYDTAKGENMTKDVYTNAIPMTRSRSGEAMRQEVNHMVCGGLGFQNENFQLTRNHAEMQHAYQGSGSGYSMPPPHSHHGSSSNSPHHTHTTTLPFDTIINYNTDDGRYQTLIM